LVVPLTLTLTLTLNVALTECRLLREADAKYGWQLQKKTTEIAEVKLQAQARIGRLETQRKTLSTELKDVTRAKREAVQAAQRQYKDDLSQLSDKVKAVTRLKNDELSKVNDKHRDVVRKLEQHKADLRARVKAQRAEHKERVSVISAKSEALELLCSVSEMETKKLGRELSAEQSRVAALGVKEMFLAEHVDNLEVENDFLNQVTQTLTLPQTLIITLILTLTPTQTFPFSHRLIFRSYELTKHGKTWCVMQKC
jgi:hypothetical protein